MPPTSAHQNANIPQGVLPGSTVQPPGSVGSQQDSIEEIGQRRRAGDEQSSRATSAQGPVAAPKPEAESKSPKSSTVANAFPGGVGRFPNNPVIFAGPLAIFKGGARAGLLMDGWQQSESGRLFYVHPGNRGGRILLYPTALLKPDEALTILDKQRQFIGRLTPFTADVALGVLAQLCEPSLGDRPKFPMLEPVLITATAILRWRTSYPCCIRRDWLVLGVGAESPGGRICIGCRCDRTEELA